MVKMTKYSFLLLQVWYHGETLIKYFTKRQRTEYKVNLNE